MPESEDTPPPVDPRWAQFKGFAFEDDTPMRPRDYLYQLDVDLNIEAHLIAVYGLLAKTKEADREITEEIEGWRKHIETLTEDDAYQYAESQWIDCLHQSTYHAAAHSMAALGMLAPLLESLFHQYLRAICQKLTELGEPLGGHPRWMGHPDERSDCHLVWENNRFKKDLVLGVEQMSDALGLAVYFPADYKEVIDALYLYRNKMFHNGFEWPMEARRAFDQTIRDKGFPAAWFSKATSGTDPVAFYMTEAMILKVIATVDAVLDGIAAYSKDRITPLRLRQNP